MKKHKERKKWIKRTIYGQTKLYLNYQIFIIKNKFTMIILWVRICLENVGKIMEGARFNMLF